MIGQRLVVSLLALTSLAIGQTVGPRTYSAPAKEAIKRAAIRSLPSLQAPMPSPPEHRLPALSEDLIRREITKANSVAGPKLAGLHRGLAASAIEDGRWYSVPGGQRVWRFALNAPGATGIRVRFSNFSAGSGRVWVHDGSGSETQIFGPYTGRGVFDDGEFWSDVVLAETIFVEFEPAAGTDSFDPPPFEIAEVTQLLDGALGLSSTSKAGSARSASASCNLDVSCFPEWAETARAVGHIVFEHQGGTFVCSGTLMNTTNGGGQPLFLTADHCISDEATARTVQAFWFYQSQVCNGTPATRRESPRTLGARYLAGAPMSGGDFTLVQLNEMPSGVLLSGWNADPVAAGIRVTGIHHPAGDPKKISFGTSEEGRRFTGINSSLFVAANWQEGVTEGGSSGSGLFSSPGVLVGMLSHGPKVDSPEQYCTIRPLIDNYGRFSVAYPALRQFLDGRNTAPPPPPPPPPTGQTGPLTSGQARTFNFEAVQNPTLFGGSSSFQINVPQGATRLEIRLATSTPNADLDLFVRFGSEPEVSGGSVVSDYSSEGATGNETVVITPQSSPALRSGTYFISLGVFTTGTSITGTVTATVTTGGGGSGGQTGGNLTSGTPRSFNLGAVQNPTLFNGSSSFQVVVPEGATRLEVRVQTATPNVDVDLFVRRGSDPVVEGGQIIADYRSEGATGEESIVVTSTSSPALRAGTYFIALAQFTSNVDTTGTITATVTTGGGTPPPSGAGPLASGTPVQFQIGPVSSATLLNAARSYTINVPQGATRLEIRLQTSTPNADVDLFARFGSDTTVQSGSVVSDHRSEGPSGDESIVVTSTSNPPLRSGTYYVSLALFTTNTAVSGTLRATVSSGDNAPPPAMGGGMLTSGTPQNYSLPAADSPTLYTGDYSFRVRVPDGATRLDVRLSTSTTNADVDLFVRYEAEPGVLDGSVISDYRSEGPTGSETISVTPSSIPPLRPGVYYISLANFSTNLAVNGTVTATVTTAGQGAPPPNAPTVLTSGTPAKFRLPSVESPALYNGVYSFQINVPEGSTRLQVQLTSDTPAIDVDLYVRNGTDPVLDSGNVIADYASTGSTGNETISITAGSVPALRAGTYYISLALFTSNATATGSVTATVERGAVTPPASGAQTLRSGVPAQFSLPAVSQPTFFSGDYGFRINVPADSDRLEIVLRTDPSNVDVDLAVRYGAEPTALAADHRSAGDTGNEQIIIRRETVPPLRTGTYFIALPVFTTGIAPRGTITATVVPLVKSGDETLRKTSSGITLDWKRLAIAEPLTPEWKTGSDQLVKASEISKRKPLTQSINE